MLISAKEANNLALVSQHSSKIFDEIRKQASKGQFSLIYVDEEYILPTIMGLLIAQGYKVRRADHRYFSAITTYEISW